MKKQRSFNWTLLVLAAMLLPACSIKDITQTLNNIKSLQYKLGAVDNYRLAGVRLDDKRSVSDFSALDALKLTRAFTSGELPATFTLNLLAHNPNDGKEGRTSTPVTLNSIDFRLYIDDKQTIQGDINSPVTVPGGGQTQTIPIQMTVDLARFFGDKSYEDVARLALALGGVEGSAARLTLDIKPTVETSILGKVTYPGRIKVIDKEFRQ